MEEAATSGLITPCVARCHAVVETRCRAAWKLRDGPYARVFHVWSLSGACY